MYLLCSDAAVTVPLDGGLRVGLVLEGNEGLCGVVANGQLYQICTRVLQLNERFFYNTDQQSTRSTAPRTKVFSTICIHPTAYTICVYFNK